MRRDLNILTLRRMMIVVGVRGGIAWLDRAVEEARHAALAARVSIPRWRLG